MSLHTRVKPVGDSRYQHPLQLETQSGKLYFLGDTILSDQQATIRNTLKMISEFNHNNFENIDHKMTFLEEIGIISTKRKYTSEKIVDSVTLKLELSAIVNFIKSLISTMSGVQSILTALDVIGGKLELELIGKLNSTSKTDYSEVDLAMDTNDHILLVLVKLCTKNKSSSKKYLLFGQKIIKYKLEYCIYYTQVKKDLILNNDTIKKALNQYDVFSRLPTNERIIRSLDLKGELIQLSNTDIE